MVTTRVIGCIHCGAGVEEESASREQDVVTQTICAACVSDKLDDYFNTGGTASGMMANLMTAKSRWGWKWKKK